MSDALDDELARFQAELAALEQEQGHEDEHQGYEKEAETETNTVVKKRAREPEDSSHTKRSKIEVATPVVIMAAPQLYRSSDQRADSKPTYAERDDQNCAVEASSMSQGALSGFPVGTSGELAARALSLASSRPANVPRLDMVTGELLPADEQHLMNMQQSAYEYDPRKFVVSTKTTAAAAAAIGSSSVDATAANTSAGSSLPRKPTRNLRLAGGEIWEDPTLADWPDNDFRLFVGDLGNEVSDEILAHAFSRYPSFQRSRVVRDKSSHKTRGYGFVSFADAFDCAKAAREMNGKYIGNRPVKIQKSKWQERNIDVARKKHKRKSKHLFA